MSEPTPEEIAERAANMKVEPRDEHRWLRKLIGDWTYETEAPGPPGQPPATLTGIERVRAIGEIWVQGESNAAMPDGSPATSVITLGFDPAKGRFVGTWLGSMMTNLWVYDGELDASGRVLTLSSEGPSMAGDGTMSAYRDVIEFRSDDERVLTGHVRGADGEWQPFVSMTYRRS